MSHWYHARAVTHSSLVPGPEGQRQQSLAPSLTATETATAAANGKQQRSVTMQHTRTIRRNLGYVRPEKRKVEGLSKL
jgi:hypothetical protein